MQPTCRTPVSAMDAYTSRASASVSSSRVSMKMNSITAPPSCQTTSLSYDPRREGRCEQRSGTARARCPSETWRTRRARRRRAPPGHRLRHLRHRCPHVLQRRPAHHRALGARPRDQRRADRDRRGGSRGGRPVGPVDRRPRPLHLDALVRALPPLPLGQRAPLRQRRADGLRPPGRLRRDGGDPADRAEEPLPDPRRPLRRPRDLRRPALGRDLRPQGHRRLARRHGRGDRRRAGRHRARPHRPARGRRAAC